MDCSSRSRDIGSSYGASLRECLEGCKVPKDHKAVKWVKYPGLEDDAGCELAQKQFGQNCGGMVVFGIEGGIAKGATLLTP